MICGSLRVKKDDWNWFSYLLISDSQFSCFRLSSRGGSDYRGRGSAQRGRDNSPSEVGHHRQVPQQPPSETEIRHLGMWVLIQTVSRVGSDKLWGSVKWSVFAWWKEHQEFYSSGMMFSLCLYNLHRMRFSNKYWHHSSHIPPFSRDSQPLRLVLSGESGVLLRQVAPDIWEHPRPLPQGGAPPHRERLS